MAVFDDESTVLRYYTHNFLVSGKLFATGLDHEVSRVYPEACQLASRHK